MTLRNMCMLTLMILWLATSLGLPAYSADQDGRFSVRGVGRASCGSFIKIVDKKLPEFRQFGGWMSGYITALNQLRVDTFDLVLFEDSDTLIRYIERFCRANPTDTFVVAVRRIVNGLEPTRVHRFTGLVKFGEAPVVGLYRQAVQIMTKRLRDLNYLQSGDSEALLADLSKALKSFQEKEGLKPTGRPDQLTLVRLIRKRD